MPFYRQVRKLTNNVVVGARRRRVRGRTDGGGTEGWIDGKASQRFGWRVAAPGGGWRACCVASGRGATASRPWADGCRNGRWSYPAHRTQLGERTRRSRAPTHCRLCRDAVPTLPMSGIGGWRL